MKVKVYVIDLELSPSQKRRWRWFAAACALVLVGGGIAYADGVTSFVSGHTLTADQLNGSFGYVEQQIAALQSFQAQITMNGAYSPSATYCGYTAPTQGSMGGYPGASALCRGSGVTGSCSSASAHMCTAQELVRTREAGLPISFSSSHGYAWYSSGVNDGTRDDCDGWTSTANAGEEWSSSGNFPTTNGCNESDPVLCCN